MISLTIPDMDKNAVKYSSALASKCEFEATALEN